MKKCNRIIALLTVIAMALVMLTGCGGGKNAQDSSLADLEIGDVINYGSYKQSVEFNQDPYDVSLYEPEPIRWRMVDKRDGFGLFVSENVLDYYPYNNENKAISYADSDLRKWLGKDFINTAFSRDERKIIRPEAVFDYNNKDREDNKDKIFILSYDEVMQYFPDERGRAASPTKYASARGTWRNADNHCCWWLRADGTADNFTAYVTETGEINASGEQVNAEYLGVRPAMWLRLGNWPKGHGPTF